LIRFIIGLFLTTYLPGLVLTYIIFKKNELNFAEKICFSFGLSIFVTIIIGFLMPKLYFGALLSYYGLFFMICLPLAAARFFWGKSRSRAKDEIKSYFKSGKKKYSVSELRTSLNKQGLSDNIIDSAIEDAPVNKKIMRGIIICLILLFNCFIVYSPHIDYPYPFHYDEWAKIEGSVNSIADRNFWEQGVGAKTEGGFYMYLIPMILAADMDPILDYKYFPMIFMAMASLALYCFLKRVTGSFSVAIFAMLFFASLKTNVNVLGPWFFTPLTMAFPFIYLFFYSFVRGVNNGSEKFFIVSCIFLLSLVMIHFFSALFIVPIAAIYLIVNWRFVSKKFYLLLPALVIPFLGFLFSMSTFPKGKGIQGLISIVLDKGLEIAYPVNWISLLPKYKLLVFYGTIAVVLACIGFVLCIKKNRIFSIWAAVTGIWFYCNMLLSQGAGYLIPYLSLLFYFLLALVPLSAIGLRWCIKQIEEKLNLGKFFTIVVYAGLLLTVFITTFSSYYDVPSNLDLYRYILPEDAAAISRASDSVLITVPIFEMAYKLFDLNAELVPASKFDFEFASKDCGYKEEIMLKNKIFYLLTDKKQDCDFLELVYLEKSRFLYKTSAI
jgi:hypothetical protein